jgi:hypothetical protein
LEVEPITHIPPEYLPDAGFYLHTEINSEPAIPSASLGSLLSSTSSSIVKHSGRVFQPVFGPAQATKDVSLDTRYSAAALEHTGRIQARQNVQLGFAAAALGMLGAVAARRFGFEGIEASCVGVAVSFFGLVCTLWASQHDILIGFLDVYLRSLEEVAVADDTPRFRSNVQPWLKRAYGSRLPPFIGWVLTIISAFIPSAVVVVNQSKENGSGLYMAMAAMLVVFAIAALSIGQNALGIRKVSENALARGFVILGMLVVSAAAIVIYSQQWPNFLKMKEGHLPLLTVSQVLSGISLCVLYFSSKQRADLSKLEYKDGKLLQREKADRTDLEGVRV